MELIRVMEDVQRCRASLAASEQTVRRRGRKSMGTAERQQVSERMKRYWAIRRAAQEDEGWAATG